MITDFKTPQEYQEAIDSGKLVFIDFFAKWCGACKMFDPVLKEIAEKYENNKHVAFYKLDVEELNQISNENAVNATPTLVFFYKGQEVWRFIGYLDYDSMHAKIERLLEEYHLKD